MMNKTTKTIAKYLIELLIVAFGVFLGFFVSEWKSQQKIDANTKKTISFIIDEMDSNIEKIEKAINYQQQLLTHVDTLSNTLNRVDVESIYYTNRKFRFDQLPNWRGFGFPNLENIMFESAKINGVLPELDITTTQLIARLYQKQQKYIIFGEQINDRLVTLNSATKVVDVLVLFEMVQFDGLVSGRQLLSEMQKTKEKLKETKYNQ